jgi:hypothetical protein
MSIRSSRRGDLQLSFSMLTVCVPRGVLHDVHELE